MLRVGEQWHFRKQFRLFPRSQQDARTRGKPLDLNREGRLCSFGDSQSPAMTIKTPATSDWKRLYQMALFETPPARIQQRIAEAQVANFERENSLSATRLCRENQELDYATRFLRLLQEQLENDENLGQR